MVGEKLALHGIEFRKLTSASAAVDAEVFRATKVTYSPATFEGHTTVTLEGQWTRERRDVPAGSLFVPIAQARSLMLMTLLEPKDPDSLVELGILQHGVRAQGVHGSVRRGGRGRADAEEGSGAAARNSSSG